MTLQLEYFQDLMLDLLLSKRPLNGPDLVLRTDYMDLRIAPISLDHNWITAANGYRGLVVENFVIPEETLRLSADKVTAKVRFFYIKWKNLTIQKTFEWQRFTSYSRYIFSSTDVLPVFDWRPVTRMASHKGHKILRQHIVKSHNALPKICYTS